MLPVPSTHTPDSALALLCINAASCDSPARVVSIRREQAAHPLRVGGLFGLSLCWLRLELGAGDLRFFDRPMQGVWELRMLFQLRRFLQLLFRHIQHQ